MLGHRVLQRPGLSSQRRPEWTPHRQPPPVVRIDPLLTGTEQLALAGFLAGYNGLRYDLNLWIGHPLEGATYLPR